MIHDTTPMCPPLAGTRQSLVGPEREQTVEGRVAGHLGFGARRGDRGVIRADRGVVPA